jgi:hypothetical protein
MKIGIITRKEFPIYKDFPLLFQYEISDYNLIIGYSYAKELYPETNFLKNKINKNTWWIYSNDEKPTDANKLTINILKEIIEEIIRNSEYKVVDPIINKIEKEQIKRFLEIKNITFYSRKGRMLFLYSKNQIFGFDIEVYKWMGWNLKEIIDFKKIKPFIIDDVYLTLFGEKNLKYIPLFYDIF